MGENKGIVRRLLPTVFGLQFFGLAFTSIYAGGLEHLLFTSEGKLINVRAGESVGENARTVNPKIRSTCAEAPGKTCIKWQLVPAAGQNASQILTSVAAALNLYSNTSSLSAAWVYNGISSQVGIPFGALDDHNNQSVAGNFLVSFVPPPAAEMPFPPGVVSTSVKYVYVDLQSNEATTQWGGIYFNPLYQPGTHYRLDTVVANEAGRLMGLAPSATRNSVMFPVQPAQSQSVLRLANDDLMYLQELYPAADATANKGSLSGEVIDGNTGNKIPGASIELIPLNQRDHFAQDATNNRRLAEGGAFSRADGKFKIPNVTPGEYVVLFESLAQAPIEKRLWDDWIFALGSDLHFETEFYDGAERESNAEPVNGFSGLMIYRAAIVKVEAQRETTNLQLITNATTLNPPEIKAQGSSNERLPELDSTIENRLLELQNAEEQIDGSGNAGSGGCSLRGERPSDPLREWGLFFALILFLLWRGDLRKEAYRFVCRTIEKFRR